jgi:hypothetical protein
LRAIQILITTNSLDNLRTAEDGMYRIELSPGDVTVFRSIEELAVAIKRGVITPSARIYHSTSGNWLPIGVHPHYRAALSMPLTQANLVAGPPVKQLDSLSLNAPVEPELPPMMAAASSSVASPDIEPPTLKKKSRAERPAPAKRSRRQSKPRRQLRIALVGALLIGGAQWVLSAPLFSRAEPPALLRTQRHLISAPIEAMKRVSSPNTAAMIPVLPNSTSTATPATDPAPAGHGLGAPSFGGIGVTVETAEALEADSIRSNQPDSTRNPSLQPILPNASSPASNRQPTPR